MSKRKNKAVWAATALPKIVRKQVSAERPEGPGLRVTSSGQ